MFVYATGRFGPCVYMCGSGCGSLLFCVGFYVCMWIRVCVCARTYVCYWFYVCANVGPYWYYVRVSGCVGMCVLLSDRLGMRARVSGFNVICARVSGCVGMHVTLQVLVR